MTKHFITLVLGILLLGFGCGYFWFEVTDLKFIKELPKNEYKKEEKNYTFPLLEQDGKYYIYADDFDVELKESNERADQIKIQVLYYTDFNSISHSVQTIGDDDQNKFLYFETFHHIEFNDIKNISMMVKKDLKTRSLHNYNAFFHPKLVVTIPEGQKENVIISSLWSEKEQTIMGQLFYER